MKNELVTQEATPSLRFTQMVERQYSTEVGQLDMSDHERQLLQHLFIKCDSAFIEANSKQGKDQLPIVWKNINMTKLAIDAVHRIRLGLDALIPGHIFPIAYYNKDSKLYDIDLRIGYKGEAYYIRKASMRTIKDIRVELVYSTDEFIVYKKGLSSKVEGYDFHIKQPFDRGDLVGGFAYLEYEDDSENVLIVLSKKSFDKYRSLAKSATFWNQWYEEMCYKTLVHRIADKVTIDPMKISAQAIAAVQVDADRPEPVMLPQQNAILLELDPDALATPEVESVAVEVEGVVSETPPQDAEAEPADEAPAKAKRKPAFS